MSQHDALFDLNAENINATAVDNATDLSFNPPLVGIVISGVGTLQYDNDKGNTVNFVVPASVADETVTALPFTLWGKITRIDASGTTIAGANLVGLRKTGVPPS
jgi:hypothetical protein